MATPPIPFVQFRTVLGKHTKLSTYHEMMILLKAKTGLFSIFVVTFFVVSIILVEQIIKKKKKF